MKLHTFFFSSASYRVRIALNLKGINWETIPVNLRAGEQNSDAFKSINKAGLVPTLQDGDVTVSQSIAIFDYLDQVKAEPKLIPVDLAQRHKVWEITLLIACEIHPLNNLRVLKYLTGPMNLSEQVKNEWYAHWIKDGFEILEGLLSDNSTYCVGDQPTMADCFLVPQVANAIRMNVDISAFPKIRRINDLCLKHPAFEKAAPQNQPDFKG
jgi:maleylacetoacetate isomerase